MNNLIRLSFVLLLMMSFSWCAFAQEGVRFSNKRSKVINFEDEVIEGVNRKSLDSVAQITEQNRKNKIRLYQKRVGFSDLNKDLVNQVRLTQ